MKMNKELLIDVLSKICYYAQDHSAAWDVRGDESHFDHTSHVVSCFISQNTLHGDEGVDWDIVLDELTGEVKNEEQWKKIIEKLVDQYSTKINNCRFINYSELMADCPLAHNEFFDGSDPDWWGGSQKVMILPDEIRSVLESCDYRDEEQIKIVLNRLNGLPTQVYVDLKN
jgi:hypothetical protein